MSVKVWFSGRISLLQMTFGGNNANFMNILWILLTLTRTILNDLCYHIASVDSKSNVIHFPMINKFPKNHWFVRECDMDTGYLN